MENNAILQSILSSSEPDIHFLVPQLAELDKKIVEDFSKRMKELYQFTSIAENPTDFLDESRRYVLFGQLSYGMRKAGEGYAWAKSLNKEYHRVYSQMEADIKMNEYPKWVSEQKKLDSKFKTTEDYKKTYINTVDSLQKIIKYTILTDVMMDEFATIKTELFQSISTIKAICYGFKDSTIASGSSFSL